MKYASKKEAQAALTAARFKAQSASEAFIEARTAIPTTVRAEDNGNVEYDAALLHYQRCVRELEEAINDYDAYDTRDD